MGSVAENALRSWDAEQNATEPFPRYQSGPLPEVGQITQYKGVYRFIGTNLFVTISTSFEKTKRASHDTRRKISGAVRSSFQG
jgi:hypothetical protein